MQLGASLSIFSQAVNRKNDRNTKRLRVFMVVGFVIKAQILYQKHFYFYLGD
jgi:hypothetical protein